MSEGCVFVRGPQKGSGIHVYVGEFNDVEMIVLECVVPNAVVEGALEVQAARTLAEGILALLADLERSAGVSSGSRPIAEEDLGPVVLDAETSARAFPPSKGGRSQGGPI